METDAERITFTDSLYQITEQMTHTDTEQFKFLCSDHIPIGSLENMDISDILQSLLERKLIKNNDIHFLTECLILIGRLDIVHYLGCDQIEIERCSANLKIYKSTAGLNSFKILLFHLADELTTYEVKKMILYLSGALEITKGKLKTCQTGFELMTLLIKSHYIHPNKLSNLIDLTQRLNRIDLKEKIKLYEDEHFSNYTATKKPKGHEDLSNYTATKNLEDNLKTLISRIPPEHLHNFCRELNIPSKKYQMYKDNIEELLKEEPMSDIKKTFKKMNLESLSPSKEQRSLKTVNSLKNYEMTARPRGICLIFNNVDFQSNNLKSRTGSNVDRDALKKLFEQFHFEINLAQDLTKVGMEEKLSDIASLDHTKYDCFVCFILSHGEENKIFGVDGGYLSYKNLTAPFKPLNCKSLAGKPKLFFIQACQGQGYQEGETVWESDGPCTSIPNEADFLIASATVPGYVSFRSKTTGSWFIQNLCDVFHENAKSLDLSDMLLMVNESVSKKEGEINDSIYKQVSAPLSTLRKKIYFLGDSQ